MTIKSVVRVVTTALADCALASGRGGRRWLPVVNLIESRKSEDCENEQVFRMPAARASGDDHAEAKRLQRLTAQVDRPADNGLSARPSNASSAAKCGARPEIRLP